MSSQEKKLNQEVFTSVGNAWMLCRSKTHRGHVYYFNTLTGETAWNLSDAEMEKAKRRTRDLANQLETNIQNCPEPKEPPDHTIHRMATRTTNSITPSKIYNKQIINNQYPKNPLALNPFVSPQCSNCSPLTQLIPQSSSFNPNVWAIPQNHPIFISPAAPNMLYQQQPTYNLSNTVAQNIQKQKPSVPLHNDNYNWETKTPISFKYLKKNYNKWGSNRSSHKRKPNMWKYETKNMSLDLRQVLAEKRKRSNSNPTQIESTTSDTKDISLLKQNSTQTDECVSSSQDTLKDELYSSDIDEEWLEENTHYQGVKPLINVAPLTALSKENARSDCWYIVVDTSVLLNNLDFLNVLVNSDENCLLMTPRSTEDELKITKETGSSQEKKRSRRALFFLSQQISSGCAFLGEDVYQDPDLGNHEALICCSFLTEQNNHAIMLSNNPDVLQYRNSVAFPFFSIPDLKEFLVAREPEKECKYSETEDVLQDRPLTVTITNDFKDDSVDEPENQCVNTVTQVSIAVQTDIDDAVLTVFNDKWLTPLLQKDVPVSEATTTTINDKSAVADEQPSKSLLSSNTSTNQNATSEKLTCFISRKREIRLKRNLLNQETGSGNHSDTKEKKQFKWHRRRNKSISETVSKTVASNDDQNKQNKNINTETYHHQQESCELDQQSSNKSVLSESPMKRCGNFSFGSDIAANSENSFTYVPRRNVDESVVVEETSTSGVMSNSASIADSESMGNSFQAFPFTYTDSGIKNVMFEITSRFMEDNLRRKRDEWLSRFTQIMEDALTEILQQDPAFVDSRMSPPWTMHEAVECMKRKFCKNFDVVDACSKLSNILLKISDSKGVITQNISPTNFMEMYSYGVYLIDTLLSYNYNEDLQIAAESLSNLLTDIQDPVTDTTHNDSFTKNMNDLSINAVEPSCSPIQTPKKNQEKNISSPKKMYREATSKPSPSNSSNTKYHLRSKRDEIQKEAENSPKDIQFIRRVDVESTFFSSLKLQKKMSNTDEEKDNPDTFNGINKNGCADNSPVQKEGGNNVKDVNKNNTVETSEPKIIRNFTQCFEFEQRLKNKQKENLDLDHLDYGEDSVDNNYDYNDENFENDFFDEKSDTINESLENGDSYCYDTSNTYAFKVFIGQLWCEIKDIFSTVHVFCVDTIKQLSSPSQLTCSKILKIKYEAQVAQLDIRNLCEALVNIKLDEINSQEYSVQDKLRKAGLEIEISCDLMLDEEQFQKYRDIVTKCRSQAEILLESIHVILNAIGK